MYHVRFTRDIGCIFCVEWYVYQFILQFARDIVLTLERHALMIILTCTHIHLLQDILYIPQQVVWSCDFVLF